MESDHIPVVEKKSKPGKEYLLYQEHTSSIIVGFISPQCQVWDRGRMKGRMRGEEVGLDELNNS